MGIRQLQSFMQHYVDRGVYTIQLENEIKKAKAHGKKPLIVIDFLTMYGFFCNDKYATLCGGQMTLVAHVADTFFKRLTVAGAELVFFTDGLLQPEKCKTWVERQNNKYENMNKITDAIDSKTPLPQVIRKFGFNIPTNTLIKMKRVAQRHGEMTISMQLECDQALAAYASKHKALAIISSDTDFLIYQGDWKLWSPNHINPEKLETLEYNREALLRTLGLQWHQMPLWATLAGNDFFKYNEVEQFHRSLGQHYQKFYKLAEYVRSVPFDGQMVDNTINTILQRVYTGRSMPQDAIDCFKQSMAFYENDTKSLNLPSSMDPMENFLLSLEQHFVLSMLHGDPYNCSIQFFDYRSQNFGSCFKIIIHIIARIVGIILFHDQSKQRKQFQIITKRSHTEPYARYTVPAEIPSKMEPPKIMELLSSDDNVSAALLDRKLELLAWICSDDLHYESFSVLPKPMILTILALYRLSECSALTVFEADLLLIIAHELTTGGFDPAAESIPFLLNPRAFRIGFLFQKVYAEFSRAAKALGLTREYRPMIPYDGFRFHNQYNACSNGKLPHHQIQSIANWRLYIRHFTN